MNTMILFSIKCYQFLRRLEEYFLVIFTYHLLMAKKQIEIFMIENICANYNDQQQYSEYAIDYSRCKCNT